MRSRAHHRQEDVSTAWDRLMAAYDELNISTGAALREILRGNLTPATRIDAIRRTKAIEEAARRLLTAIRNAVVDAS